jgi:lipoate-protein ligase A
MHFLTVTLPTLEANLALDEALLLDAEEGNSGEVLRVWQWPHLAVVLGAGGVIHDDVHIDACRADGIPLARRSSGGGTVLLGPRCLVYSLVLLMDDSPDLTRIASSYRVILGRVAQALEPLTPGIEQAGSSDLVLQGRKFSGNAQQRKRRYLLHHGTLLHGLDLEAMNRYLKLPPRRPEYRGQRSHADFLTCLPDRPREIIAGLKAVFGATDERMDWPRSRVEQLVAEKYGQAAWVWRR